MTLHVLLNPSLQYHKPFKAANTALLACGPDVGTQDILLAWLHSQPPQRFFVNFILLYLSWQLSTVVLLQKGCIPAYMMSHLLCPAAFIQAVVLVVHVPKSHTNPHQFSSIPHFVCFMGAGIVVEGHQLHDRPQGHWPAESSYSRVVMYGTGQQ